MASVKFGMLITEAAGKVGGQILQRGRTGGQLRNLSKPPLRNQNSTAFRKLPFAIVSQTWRTLTPSQIIDWNNLALTQTRSNKFGDPYTPTGFQLFTELNLNLRLISLVTSVTTAPTLVSLPDVADFIITASTGPDALSLDWIYTSGDTGWRVVPYFVSCRLPGSVDAYKTAKLMQLPTPVATATIDLTPAIAFYSMLGYTSGNIINLGYRLIHNTTGQGSPLYRLSDLIS
jgi:hypothetical protein